MSDETSDFFDFGDGNGPVLAHRHCNSGGWVADTAYVAETASVGPDALVFGNAVVSGYAKVYGNARVCDYARVFGSAWVYGNAVVSGYTKVFGHARVFGNAVVSGYAKVYGNARVYDYARVFGSAWVYGNAKVFGNTVVFGNAVVYGNAVVSGYAKVYGNARVYDYMVAHEMSDDLVKRLHERQEFEFIDGYKRVEWEDEDALEAADRIEELEAGNKALRSVIEEVVKSTGDDPEIMAASRAEWAARALAVEARVKELEAELALYRTPSQN